MSFIRYCTLSRGLLRPHMVTFLLRAPVALYNRKDAGREKSNKQLLKDIKSSLDDPYGFQFGQQLEEQLDEAEKNFSAKQAQSDLTPEEEKQMRERLKKKIIQRKYFKQEPELNLLTWDAKEQMRFLHAEYPEEWTIERLAQSFPVSKEGVVRVLKSKFYPRTVQELIAHDRRVQKRWKALREGQVQAGPIKTRYEAMLESGKLHLLANATGIPSLPKPQDQALKLLQASKPQDKTPGLFESMLKDYHKLKKQKDEVVERIKAELHPTPKLLEDHRRENSNILKDLYFEETAVVKSEIGPTKVGTQEEPVIKVKKLRRRVQYTDKNLKTDMLNRSEGPASEDIESLLDVKFDPNDSVEDYNNKAHTKFQYSEAKKVASIGKEETLDLGMVGTGKISSGSLHVPYETDLNIPYRKTESDNAIQKNLEDQPYIYSSDYGYQFPYGRTKDIPQNIKSVKDTSVPNVKNSSTKLKVYKKGSDFYDENGEFLYRIPFNSKD